MMRLSRGLVILAAMLFAIISAGECHADQTDPRLDQLFAELRIADDAVTARVLEAQIWALWSQTTDDARQLLVDGTEHLSAGDLEGALAIFDRLVTQSPRFAEAWNKRATTLYLLDRFSASIADIEHVLTLEPRHFGAISGLAMCNEKLGRTQQALDALRRAQTIDPRLHDIDRSIDALKKQLERESI